MVVQRSCLVLLLLLDGLFSYGQSPPNPTDTSYVNELLRKAEAIETRQSQTALATYQKAHQLAEKIGYTKGYFDSVRLLAYLLNNLGRHTEAHTIAQKALQLARKDTSRRNLSISYFALANTSLHAGQLKQAVPYYQQAAYYMKQIGKLKNVAVINQNLGYIYEQQRLFPQSLVYYQRSLAFNLTDPADRRSIAIDYFSIANVLSKQNKASESRRYYQKAEHWIDAKNDLDFVINLYNNIGYDYSAEACYDSALYYQRHALQLSRQVGNPRHELHMLMALAQTNSRMKRFREAKALLDQSYKLAVTSQAGLTELRNIYREYAVATNALRDYRAAAQWLDKYIGVDDSLDNQETKALLQDYELQLKRTESRQKLLEKQRRIDQLEAGRKRQNLWLLVAVLTTGLVALGAGLGYLYYQQRQRSAANSLLAAERERELAVLQSELHGQQKERLRISKEMHDDLGASLTAIGLLSEVVKTRMGLATSPEVEKISAISAEMVSSMNEIIWSLNTRNDSLNGLIAYTRAYASEFIENTSLNLRTEVAESPYEINVRGADRRNVFLTVKEALNNVVKHAQATQVMLRIQPDAEQLTIQVCDNGRGFEPSEQSGNRNGLTNMQNRMAESGGRCQISSTPDGTCVKIVYPYPSVPVRKIPQM
ncbi:tetratricopeptide repeat-containing sensor histidine kinase [Spirosoma fluminis]